MARFCRFYGMTPNELLSLQSDIAYQMMAAISAIEAHESTILYTASDWPYLKPEKRSMILRGLNKQANAAIIKPEEIKELSPSELTSFFNQ